LQIEMGNSSDLERKTLIDALLKRLHEQSSTRAEPSPFWREGQWRCEFHRRDGDERLKVFSGDRCVHEESVQGRAVADRRAQELLRVVRSQGGGPEITLSR
jgi:hypothetical protein